MVDKIIVTKLCVKLISDANKKEKARNYSYPPTLSLSLKHLIQVKKEYYNLSSLTKYFIIVIQCYNSTFKI